MRIIIFAFVCCLLITSVLGLGMMPVKSNLNYDSDKLVTLKICSNKDTFAKVYVEEITDLFELEKNIYEIPAGCKKIELKLVSALNLEPGEYNGYLVIQEVALKDKNIFSSIRLNHKLSVYVAPAENYIEIYHVKQESEILLKLENKGTIEVNNIFTNTEVRSMNKTIEERSKEYSLSPGEKSTLNIDYPEKPGRYDLVTSIDYDEEIRVEKDSIQIGNPDFEIIFVDNRFNPEKLNRFKIKLKSKWNEPIDVYAIVNLTDKVKFETPHVLLEPYSYGYIEYAMDVSDFDLGDYELNLLFKYGNNEKQYDEIVVVTDKEEKMSLLAIVIFVILFIVTVILSYLTYEVYRNN